MLDRGRLIGAIAVGTWDDVSRVQEAVLNRRRLWPWQRRRFRRTGEIWPATEALDVARWPATAIVCNCTGVTRGQLTDAIDGGCDSVEQLSASTGASSVCGSCRPLLTGLVGQSGAASPVQGQTALVTAALLAMLGAFGFALAPVIPFADTVQVELRWDQLWRDGLLKQVSGFSLLGLGLLISVLSLRKRLRWFQWGDFPLWRVVHALLGGAAVALLIAHTGLRLGENLDRWLMLCFLATLLLGGAFAAVIAVEHRLGPTLARRLRGTGFWLHLLLVWPLPVLLGIHVLKAYFF
jgi:nitrite reductase (NADH) large subunit